MAEGKNLVGVDIGASSIKVVQLKEARKKLQVIRWGFAALPPQTIIDGHVMNAGAVTEALARVFTDAKIQQRDVAIGVYGQSVIVRKITVPMMTAAELDEQIHWEAEQHIPFDIKLMSIDYEVLRRRPEAGQMDLLLVAAKKDEINDYAAILREAKLKPVVVDINAFTIQNIFEHQYGLPPDGTIALLNVGAAVSSLNIVSKGVSAFTREITNAGQRHHRGDPQGARAARTSRPRPTRCGGGPTQIVPQEVTQIINQACQGLAGEIQRSLDFYLATSGEQEIGRIYVSGGSAYLAPLVQAIEKRARVPVQLFDPMVNLAVDTKSVNEPTLAPWRRRWWSRSGSQPSVRQGAPPMVRVNLLPDAGRRARAAERARPTRRSSGSSASSARSSLTIVVCLFVQKMKQDELAAILRENQNTQGQIDAIKKQIANHDEIKAKLQGAARSRGGHPEAPGGAHRPDLDAARARPRAHAGPRSDDRPRQARAAEARQPAEVYNAELGRAAPLAHLVPGGRPRREARRPRARRRGRERARAPPQAVATTSPT